MIAKDSHDCSILACIIMVAKYVLHFDVNVETVGPVLSHPHANQKD